MRESEEELKEEEAMKERVRRTMLARAAIVNYLGPFRKGTSDGTGLIDCPVCKQPQALSFLRSGYNGHIHARCNTEDCVSWME